jgi:hypothetical protein
MTGYLEAPGSDSADSDPNIQFGPESDATKFRWAGPKDEPQLKILGDRFFVRMENGKLLLTTRVRDRNGAIVVDIVDNKWTISSAQNVSWDKNYLKNALEVKDGRGRVVLQLLLLTDVVRVQGEWWTEDGNGARVLRPYPFDRIRTGPVVVEMTPKFHPDDPHIEPIFKYPSKEYWGEFVDWFKLTQ